MTMKRWLRSDEWMELAACWGSELHTMDNPGEKEMETAAAICGECLVRPECIRWAIDQQAMTVVVAGRYIPEVRKRELKRIYECLEQTLEDEEISRGDEI